MTPEISITTAYYNRKPHFLKTLESLNMNQVKNFEVVVVDDGSHEKHRLEDIINDFSFDINLIRIEPEDKMHVNPCIPFNIAFRNARATKIMIQNPECVHTGPVLQCAINTLEKNHYLTFACWAAGSEETQNIFNYPLNSNAGESEFASFIRKIIDRYPEKAATNIGMSNCWYNHYPVRPIGYHFTSCIMKEDLYDLGGFDEKYSQGTGFDDDEFIDRINKKGMEMKIINYPMVVHLFHGFENYRDSLSEGRFKFNQNIFNNITKKEKDWRVNCL